MDGPTIPLRPKHVKQAGVYVITCQPTGQQYVGSGVSMMARWQQHRAALRGGTHHNAALQADWTRYGEPAFTCTVLEECADVSALRTREEVWIVRLRSWDQGYNVRNSRRAYDPDAGYLAWRRSFTP